VVNRELSSGKEEGLTEDGGVICLYNLSVSRKGIAERWKGAHVVAESDAGATLMYGPLSIGELGLALMITSY
jgi:hypothetical protein